MVPLNECAICSHECIPYSWKASLTVWYSAIPGTVRLRYPRIFKLQEIKISQWGNVKSKLGAQVFLISLFLTRTKDINSWTDMNRDDIKSASEAQHSQCIQDMLKVVSKYTLYTEYFTKFIFAALTNDSSRHVMVIKIAEISTTLIPSKWFTYQIFDYNL